jgi:hypothetical protein
VSLAKNDVFTNQVRVHAPVTEVLSTLNRDQLQKLLQYAINDDPAFLFHIFKNIGAILFSIHPNALIFYVHTDSIRDSESQMNAIEGAPDPTFSGLPEGEKSQWERTVEDFKKSFEDALKDRDNQ